MNRIKKKLKNAVVSGRDGNAEHALKVLRADVCRLFCDYFVFDTSNLDITADLLPSGSVSLVVSLKAEKFCETGKTLD